MGRSLMNVYVSENMSYHSNQSMVSLVEANSVLSGKILDLEREILGLEMAEIVGDCDAGRQRVELIHKVISLREEFIVNCHFIDMRLRAKTERRLDL